MDNDDTSYALSQRMAFEHTFASILTAPRGLTAGGWFIAALPASAHPHSLGSGLYAEIVHDMSEVLAAWVADRHIAESTADAVVTPVWMRTVEEIRRPFDVGGGEIDGLVLERVELFCLDNPYTNSDPAVFARRLVQTHAINRPCQHTGTTAPPP
jgi:hypothetical protein